MIKIFTVYEKRDRPHLAEAEILKATETCFWIDRKNRGFRFRTRIRRDDLWFSFSKEEALRLYILEKRQEIEALRGQVQEAELLLGGRKNG